MSTRTEPTAQAKKVSGARGQETGAKKPAPHVKPIKMTTEVSPPTYKTLKIFLCRSR